MPFDMDAFAAEARAAQLGQAVSAARHGAPRPGRVCPPASWPPGARPNYRRFDVGVLCHSGGKDGLAGMFQVVEQATGQRVFNELVRDGRLVVQYNRLGSRVSWPGTTAMGRHADRLVELYGDRPGTEEMARAHAEHFGLRFEVTERERTVVEVGPDGVKRERKLDVGDLLDHIAERGRFPDGGRRYCTSAHKRGPGRKLLTRLVKELGLRRPARVLYMFGFRAEESDARAKKIPFHYNAAASGAGTVRQVHDWYPVHHWTEDQVWSAIHAAGVPYAWPYDAGMRRPVDRT